MIHESATAGRALFRLMIAFGRKLEAKGVITVVGARDVEQISQLMAFLDVGAVGSLHRPLPRFEEHDRTSDIVSRSLHSQPFANPARRNPATK